MSRKDKPSSDLQGLNELIADATIGITDIVEDMHKRIVHPPFLPSTPFQHLITKVAGIAYNNVRRGTRLISGGLDKALEQFSSAIGTIKTTNEREALRSALNGVIGDYLEKNGNPLQIQMQFRHEGKALAIDKAALQDAYPNINGKILLMVHGSSMNDIQWTQNDHNHGAKLANELGKTPIYLLYNSGRHISTNGQELNEFLEELVNNWPVPVEETVILAHSMGGLVSRSAIHYGQKTRKAWAKSLKKVIFLGTPHHGAPLEKAGNYLDVILETIPYTQPLARLGKIRSAGVTDLRFGFLVDEDWEGADRFELASEQKQHIPLPKDVECYSIAATLSKSSKTAKPKGDKLVPVKSALGQHKQAAMDLGFEIDNTLVAYGCNHTQLLSDDGVYEQLKVWHI